MGSREDSRGRQRCREPNPKEEWNMSDSNSANHETSPSSDAGKRHSSLLEHLETMLGLLQWLSIDLLKKGAAQKAEKINRLTERMDQVGNRVEKCEDAFKDSPSTVPDKISGGLPGGLRGRREELRSDLSLMERRIVAMTGEGAVVSDEDLEGISSDLERLEGGLRAHENVISSSPEP